MKLTPFQGLFPKTNLIADLDSFFSNVKFNYPQFVDNGFYEKDPSEGIYLYQIVGKKRSHYGIVAAVAIEDLLNDKILPHEKTLAAKEQEQLQLTLQRKAFIKPILVGFKPFKSFKDFAETRIKTKPDIEQELKSKKETHRFWKINSGEELELMSKMFKKKVEKSYIADGHHRCSVARILWYQAHKKMVPFKMESILSVMMPFDQLVINDFNRVIDLGPQIRPTHFMALMSEFFKIKILKSKTKPKQKFTMTMFIDEQWYLITWKKSILNKYKKKHKVLLDYYLINEVILKKILGIEDITNHVGVKYVPGVEKFKGIKKEANTMVNPVGIMLYPMTDKEICYYADNEKVLPPKSSYFEPRVINGMIVQEIK